MRARQWFALAWCALALPGSGAATSAPRAAHEVRAGPVAQERYYTMNARVRPLFLWIRKNDVGEARITWRRGTAGAHGYELLVGSDPLKAPRKINKWGYLAEHLLNDEATIVGVMKQAKAESVEDAEGQIAREGQGGYVFETIRASVMNGQFTATNVQVRTPTDLTLRDVGALLGRVEIGAAAARTRQVPQATAPGFLTALAGLLNETTTAATTGANLRLRLPEPRVYMYNGRLYDLELRSLHARPALTAGGNRYGPVLNGDFVVINRATREVTRFSMVYGKTGELRGVPLKVVFRPKWWFEAELILGDAPH